MNYNYKYTEQNGYKKIKVSKEIHNKLFKYGKRNNWKCTYHYSVKDDSLFIEQHFSWLAIFLVFLCFPLHVILYGVSNIKEIWNESIECIPYYAKKRGTFVVDVQHNWSKWLRENDTKN